MSINEKPNEWTSTPLASSVCAPATEEHCATCSDEALPATVLCVDNQSGLALVQMEGMTIEVDVTLVEAVLPGDALLIHGGVAISRL
jgi:hypothetical protein